MATKRRFPKVRFSLGALLFVTACLAGFLAGYRYGADRKEEEQRLAVYSVVSYDVGELLSLDPNAQVNEADFATLVDIIKTTVAVDTWENSSNDILPIVSNRSLAISCLGSTHDQVAQLLEQLRRVAYKLPTDSLMKSFLSVAARKQPTPQVVKRFTFTNRHSHALMEGHFDSGLDVLRKRYGRPDSIRSIADKDFPGWISGQRIAVWEHGDGMLYFVLQDTLPDGEALLVGWHEKGADAIRLVQFNSTIATD